MKKTNSVKCLLLILVILSLFTQCKKSVEDLLGTQTSTVTFYNRAYTPVDITVNGVAKTIPAGGSVKYTANANESATGSATTSGKTATGSQLGVLMTWSWTSLFFPPGGGNIDYMLDVPSTYFFLNLKNVSTKNIQKVYVNYGYANQSTENILIPNDGLTYGIGYYLAFTNSNVRAESASGFWYWNPVSLSFLNNQSITLTAN